MPVENGTVVPGDVRLGSLPFPPDCHAYYCGDEDVWDPLVAQRDWGRLGAMFHHIATILELDKAQQEADRALVSHGGRWGWTGVCTS